MLQYSTNFFQYLLQKLICLDGFKRVLRSNYERKFITEKPMDYKVVTLTTFQSVDEAANRI